MKAVLLRGGPEFVKQDLTENYYEDIKAFISGHGIECYDDPDMLDKVDLIVAHGKAVPIVQSIIPSLHTPIDVVFLGHPAGVINPEDQVWQAAGKGMPPDDHLIFTANQKLALQKAIEVFTAKSVKPVNSKRQSAGNRPGVK